MGGATTGGNGSNGNGLSSRFTQVLLGIMSAAFLAWAGVVWRASEGVAVLSVRVINLEAQVAEMRGDGVVPAVHAVKARVDAMQEDYTDRFTSLNRRIDELRQDMSAHRQDSRNP